MFRPSISFTSSITMFSKIVLALALAAGATAHQMNIMDQYKESSVEEKVSRPPSTSQSSLPFHIEILH